MALEFRWDPKKAVANLRKHGVSFEDAATAFGDPYSVTIPDPDHSSTEHRYTLIGTTTKGLLVVVAHTERGATIRIIGARRAARVERETYEED